MRKGGNQNPPPHPKLDSTLTPRCNPHLPSFMHMRVHMLHCKSCRDLGYSDLCFASTVCAGPSDLSIVLRLRYLHNWVLVTRAFLLCGFHTDLSTSGWFFSVFRPSTSLTIKVRGFLRSTSRTSVPLYPKHLESRCWVKRGSSKGIGICQAD